MQGTEEWFDQWQALSLKKWSPSRTILGKVLITTWWELRTNAVIVFMHFVYAAGWIGVSSANWKGAI